MSRIRIIYERNEEGEIQRAGEVPVELAEEFAEEIVSKRKVGVKSLGSILWVGSEWMRDSNGIGDLCKSLMYLSQMIKSEFSEDAVLDHMISACKPDMEYLWPKIESLQAFPLLFKKVIGADGSISFVPEAFILNGGLNFLNWIELEGAGKILVRAPELPIESKYFVPASDPLSPIKIHNHILSMENGQILAVFRSSGKSSYYQRYSYAKEYMNQQFDPNFEVVMFEPPLSEVLRGNFGLDMESAQRRNAEVAFSILPELYDPVLKHARNQKLVIMLKDEKVRYHAALSLVARLLRENNGKDIVLLDNMDYESRYLEAFEAQICESEEASWVGVAPIQNIGSDKSRWKEVKYKPQVPLVVRRIVELPISVALRILDGNALPEEREAIISRMVNEAIKGLRVLFVDEELYNPDPKIQAKLISSVVYFIAIVAIVPESVSIQSNSMRIHQLALLHRDFGEKLGVDRMVRIIQRMKCINKIFFQIDLLVDPIKAIESLYRNCNPEKRAPQPSGGYIYIRQRELKLAIRAIKKYGVYSKDVDVRGLLGHAPYLMYGLFRRFHKGFGPKWDSLRNRENIQHFSESKELEEEIL